MLSFVEHDNSFIFSVHEDKYVSMTARLIIEFHLSSHGL